MFAKKWTERLLKKTGVSVNGPQQYDPQIRNERVFRRLFVWGSLGLGDAYVDGDWDCAKLDVFFERVLRSGADYKANGFGDVLLDMRGRFLNLQSVQRAFHVAQHHYDLGNSFYEKMLGESMAYSSAYYGDGAEDLTTAQYAKFDLICKKLGLEPGMQVLEIGCGWGSFAAYAAEKYGVSVLGVTVSKEQLAYAEVRTRCLPVTYYFGDYRTIPQKYEKSFDRVVSIEMIEAVGIKNLRQYMEVASRMLKPKGKFLIQAILGSGIPDTWISTRIFPNGVLPSTEQIMSATDGLFALIDTEKFGSDYDRTLMAWDERFRNAWPAIQEITDSHGTRLYDERFYRMWRYYLLSCAGAFRSGKEVAHFVFQKD